jgi:hypothetical protein
MSLTIKQSPCPGVRRVIARRLVESQADDVAPIAARRLAFLSGAVT